MGTGEGAEFTPVELLLAAIGGCTAVDVDILTSRRAEPDSFEVTVGADKVRDAAGNHLTGLMVTFRICFPAGETRRQGPGTAARRDPHVARPVVHGGTHRRTRHAHRDPDRALTVTATG